jgi:oligopeptide transport system substrate-binding protein
MWRRELGITVELRSEDWKSFLLLRRAGNFAIARGGWMGDYNDPLTFLELFRSGSENNFVRWQNTGYDSAMERAERALNPKERLRRLAAAEAILLREVPIIPLYFECNRHRIAPKMRGWKANVLDYHLYQDLSWAVE